MGIGFLAIIMCTMGDVMRASLPSVFLLESETLISLNTSTRFDQSSLKDEEYLVYEALQQQSSLKVDEINAIIDTQKFVSPFYNVY